MMNQTLTKAPDVFGWNATLFTSAPTNIEKANLLARMFRNTNAQASPDPANPIWKPAHVLPVGDEITGREVVKHVAGVLGVSLSKAEEDLLTYYTNQEAQWDGQYKPVNYDNRVESHQRRKGLGLYYILALHPNFQLK